LSISASQNFVKWEILEFLTRKNNRIVVYEMYQDGQGPNQGRDFCENLLLVVFIDLAASKLYLEVSV
jgi:hypothetical protein